MRYLTRLMPDRVDTFVANLPDGSVQDLDLGALGEALELASCAARAAWPTVAIDDAMFVAWLAQRLDEGAISSRLAKVHAADLYLACACANGDEAALSALRSLVKPRMLAALVPYGPADWVDDMRQKVMTMLLVGDDGAAGAIARYRGRGKLGSWIYVITLRHAQRERSKKPREFAADVDLMVDRATPKGSPELQFLKREYRAEFKKAFQSAFATLTERERNLMRYEHIDGLNIDKIGELHGVHRATVARWRDSARSSLFLATRNLLGSSLGVGNDEFDSIMRLIESQFDVSLTRLLKSERRE